MGYNYYYDSIRNLFLIAKATTTISLLVSIFTIVCMWKVFEKAGKPGWASLIPIYNLVVLFEITNIKPTVLLWLLFPVVGYIIVAVYTIISYFKLARAFGQPSGFGIGLWLLNPIFMGILAFGDYQYTELTD